MKSPAFAPLPRRPGPTKESKFREVSSVGDRFRHTMAAGRFTCPAGWGGGRDVRIRRRRRRGPLLVDGGSLPVPASPAARASSATTATAISPMDGAVGIRVTPTARGPAGDIDGDAISTSSWWASRRAVSEHGDGVHDHNPAGVPPPLERRGGLRGHDTRRSRAVLSTTGFKVTENRSAATRSASCGANASGRIQPQAVRFSQKGERKFEDRHASRRPRRSRSAGLAVSFATSTTTAAGLYVANETSQLLFRNKGKKTGT